MKNLSKFGFEIHVLPEIIFYQTHSWRFVFAQQNPEWNGTHWVVTNGFIHEFRQDIVASVCDVTEDGERHWWKWFMEGLCWANIIKHICTYWGCSKLAFMTIVLKWSCEMPRKTMQNDGGSQAKDTKTADCQSCKTLGDSLEIAHDRCGEQHFGDTSYIDIYEVLDNYTVISMLCINIRNYNKSLYMFFF